MQHLKEESFETKKENRIATWSFSAQYLVYRATELLWAFEENFRRLQNLKEERWLLWFSENHLHGSRAVAHVACRTLFVLEAELEVIQVLQVKLTQDLFIDPKCSTVVDHWRHVQWGKGRYSPGKSAQQGRVRNWWNFCSGTCWTERKTALTRELDHQMERHVTLTRHPNSLDTPWISTLADPSLSTCSSIETSTSRCRPRALKQTRKKNTWFLFSFLVAWKRSSSIFLFIFTSLLFFLCSIYFIFFAL